MGQKVNPVIFRINGSWSSSWYSKTNYSSNIISDVSIRSFVKKNYSHCGIANIFIERFSDKINVIIKTSKPGVLIGKKGLDIEKISHSISKITSSKVEVRIVEVDKPDMSASLISQSIAKQLEARASFKKIMKKAIQSSMKSGALGVKICCSGRLAGAEIARTEWYKEGSIPLHTIRCDVDYSTSTAKTTYGVIGVKVWVYKGFFEKR